MYARVIDLLQTSFRCRVNKKKNISLSLILFFYYTLKRVLCLWTCQEWKALGLQLWVTRSDVFVFFLFCFVLKASPLPRYLSLIILYFNGRMTWLVKFKVLKKNSFHFITEQTVIWPLTVLGIFQNTTSLVIKFLYPRRSRTYKLKAGLSQGGFEIPHLIDAVFEYSESLSSLCPWDTIVQF